MRRGIARGKKGKRKRRRSVRRQEKSEDELQGKIKGEQEGERRDGEVPLSLLPPIPAALLFLIHPSPPLPLISPNSSSLLLLPLTDLLHTLIHASQLSSSYSPLSPFSSIVQLSFSLISASLQSPLCLSSSHFSFQHPTSPSLTPHPLLLLSFQHPSLLFTFHPASLSPLSLPVLLLIFHSSIPPLPLQPLIPLSLSFYHILFSSSTPASTSPLLSLLASLSLIPHPSLSLSF